MKKETIDPQEVDTQLLTVLSKGSMMRAEAIRRMKYSSKQIDEAAERCGVIRTNWQFENQSNPVWSLTYQAKQPEAAMFLCHDCFKWTIKPRNNGLSYEVPCRHCGALAKFRGLKHNTNPE